VLRFQLDQDNRPHSKAVLRPARADRLASIRDELRVSGIAAEVYWAWIHAPFVHVSVDVHVRMNQNPWTRNCHRQFARLAHAPTRTLTLTPNGATGEDRHAVGKGTGMGKGKGW